MPTLADDIINQDINAVQQHFYYGADVNAVDEYGFTPLIEAAIADNIEIARLLIEHGANVNLQDMTGATALHWACENNNIALAELLLSQRADPNAYNLGGQPVMVMPMIRSQILMKKLLQKYGANLNFANDFINTKLLGHMYELVGSANIIDMQNRYVEIDFEGFILEFSLGSIANSLAEFKNHFAARRLRRYNGIIDHIIAVLKRASRLIKLQQYQTDRSLYQKEIHELINQDLLVIPIGYEGHAITFIKFGDILAKCDRREDSRLYDNIVLYRMQRLENFSSEFIYNLLYNKQSGQFINEELPRILQLQPLTELKIEAQISGNCSWANVEGVIPTVFFLLGLSQHEADIPKQKSSALYVFHQWRNWNKQRALQFCIQSFKESDSLRNLCRAEILAAILFQHFRSGWLQEQGFVEEILNLLALPAYKPVLDNYIKTYLYEGQSQEGKEFSELLKRYSLF